MTSIYIDANTLNVGIGTQYPLSQLDVQGTIDLGRSGNNLKILGCQNPIIVGGALSDETTILNNSNVLTIYAPYTMNIRSSKLPKFTVNTTATGIITFDIAVNGISIYSSKPTIEIGTKYSVNGTLITNPTIISENDMIHSRVFTPGTGGTGAKVYIYST
jgi:hypothetical protein